MEEDKLLRFHEKLKDFLQKNLTFLLNIVLVFVIIAIIGGGWLYYQKSKEKKLYREFLGILQKNDLNALQNFAKKEIRSQAGLNAALIVWDVLAKKNNDETKKEWLDIMKKGYPKGLKNILSYTEAKILEDKGKREEALSIYQKLYKENSFLKEIISMDMARLYYAKNPKEAKKYYQELIEKNPEGPFTPLASYKISTLP